MFDRRRTFCNLPFLVFKFWTAIFSHETFWHYCISIAQVLALHYKLKITSTLHNVHALRLPFHIHHIFWLIWSLHSFLHLSVGRSKTWMLQSWSFGIWKVYYYMLSIVELISCILVKDRQWWTKTTTWQGLSATVALNIIHKCTWGKSCNNSISQLVVWKFYNAR